MFNLFLISAVLLFGIGLITDSEPTTSRKNNRSYRS